MPTTARANARALADGIGRLVALAAVRALSRGGAPSRGIAAASGRPLDPPREQLNREFRGKDYATNVLTFDYAQSPVVMADLVLCAPVVAREAKEQRKTLSAHYAHLLVHGTLHAQGWDHETGEADAEAMEAREIEILAGLGVKNPY
jgi:rRNA maturation RNase YbeY